MVAIRDYVMPESCFDCLFVDSLLSPDERDDRSYYCMTCGKDIEDVNKIAPFCPLMECEDTPERPRSEEIALLKQGVKELARIREQLAWIKKEVGK